MHTQIFAAALRLSAAIITSPTASPRAYWALAASPRFWSAVQTAIVAPCAAPAHTGQRAEQQAADELQLPLFAPRAAAAAAGWQAVVVEAVRCCTPAAAAGDGCRGEAVVAAAPTEQQDACAHVQALAARLLASKALHGVRDALAGPGLG
jgi:hypothetical protein